MAKAAGGGRAAPCAAIPTDPSGITRAVWCTVTAPAWLTALREDGQSKRTGIQLNKGKGNQRPGAELMEEKFGNCCSQRFQIPFCLQELRVRLGSLGGAEREKAAERGGDEGKERRAELHATPGLPHILTRH